MNKPFFSILVPVYNVSKYLDECLNSLVSQTFDDFEIILLDDGSTDDSGEKCDQWQKKDKRIRVIHRENRGLFTTRLDELEAANGEYVVFVDSDDYVAVNLLEFLFEYVKNKEYDVVTYGRYLINDKEEKKRIELAVYDDGKVFEGKNRDVLLSRTSENNDLTSIWSKCVKKKLLLDIMPQLRQYVGVNSGEDKIFTASIFSNYQKLVYTDEPLYFYRWNRDGISSTAKVKYFPDSLICRKAIKHFIETSECDNKALVLQRFWDREWYGTLYLLKEYLRFDIDKPTYKAVFNKAKDSIKQYGNCKLKYRTILFFASPVFYSVLKFIIKKIWPV